MTVHDEPAPRCLRCDRTDAQAPLLRLHYQGRDWWICPQDLPLLIHQPAKLAEYLPGAEGLGPAAHDH